jgi:hypothetical protein
VDYFHKSGASVPESNCFTYLLQYGGQLVANHMGLSFRFSFPCAPPRSVASERRFRRALFESRSGARGVRPARSSCAAPLACG